MHLFEFGDYQDLPFDDHQLKRLKDYLQVVWQNRAIFYEESANPMVSQQRLFDFNDHQVKARNYVGFFRFEGVEVHVLPKIFNTASPPTPEVCFRHVLYYLSYSHRIRFPFSLTKIATSPSLFLPEVCVFLFASYVETLLIDQPTQMYQEQTEELSFLKGQLAVDEYLKENITTGNWQKLHSRHAPLLYDNPFNRMVKYTTRWLLSVSKYAPTLVRLQRVLELLQNVGNEMFTYEDCLKIRFNEQQTAQQAILDMCMMFLGNEMINYQVGQKYNFAFLLPMELVYEDFIAGFLKQHFGELQPKFQSKKYLAQNKSSKAVFSIQPDVKLKQPALIIDTKYKVRRLPFRNTRTDVDEGDLYQMIAYALGNDCSRLLLLYPAVAEQNPDNSASETFIVTSEMLKNPLEIRAENINITTLAQAEFPQKLEQTLKIQLQDIILNR